MFSGTKSSTRATRKVRIAKPGGGGGTPEERAKPSKRFRWVFLLLGLIVIAMIGKLLFIQVIDTHNLKHKARQSRNQSLSLYNRGRIIDRNGVILAQDTLVYDIFAHPQYFWKLSRKQIATVIAPILHQPVAKVHAKLQEPYTTIALAKNQPKRIVDELLAARIPVIAIDPKTKQTLRDKQTGEPVIRQTRISGLDFSKKPTRNYPQGSLAAHVLGYVNDEADVSSGVEYSARQILKKEPPDLGKALLSGRGDLVRLEAVSPESLVSVPKSEDVTLTIDSRLQYIAERELALGLEKTHAKRGTVIMMTPQTGEILAFASLPNYPPDQFYKASAEQLKNWAITDVYPPGSTFKILTVACGLESGVINRDTKLHDTGKMKIGGWTIQNYDYAQRGAPGMIDLNYLLQHSSNIGSAKISLMIPKKTHHKLIAGFGLGQKTKIDLPGESSGILHDSKFWDESTHASIGYGYGLAATPLQVAAAVSAIANGGIWVAPHVLKKDPQTIPRRRVLSQQTSAIMTELLTKSIKEAKTSTVRLEGIDVAGKTGTSRKPSATGKGYDSNVFTSFVGYFPAQKPRVLMMVVVDSPGIGEAWGSTVAGPIFHAIAQESVGYLGLKPAKIADRKPSSKGH